MTNFENASYSSFFPYRRELHLRTSLWQAYLLNFFDMISDFEEASVVAGNLNMLP